MTCQEFGTVSGRLDEEHSMHDAIREKLIEAAREGNVTFYGDINQDEHVEGRP